MLINVVMLDGGAHMPLESFTVQNVKCDGCASNIEDGLLKHPGVIKVEVEIETV